VSRDLDEAAGDPSVERLIDGIEGEVKPRRPSLVYVVGLGVVAVAMIILPLLYIGLIASTGYGLYYHAVKNVSWWTSSRHSLLKAVVYILPLLVGFVLLLFLLKPLFSRRFRWSCGLEIDQNHEPGFVAYVARLCEAMNAPVPHVIKVDCDVNASAALRYSLRGTRLTLTVGLPLMTTLTVQEFAGVLAHEFGHFTQRFAMLFSYIIRLTNNWFARVVYARDAWDAQLVVGSRSDDSLSIVLLLARLFIGITRGILWVLMMIGHGISCFMTRQMEYDADRAQALVAGSDSFLPAMTKVHLLVEGMHQAGEHLRASWQDRKLVDNLPALIGHKARHVAKVSSEEVAEAMERSRTKLFDTHPSTRNRIASVKRLQAPGVIHDDVPASRLFRNFDVVCKAATLVYYREVLGPGVTTGNLIDTSKLLRQHAQEDAEQEALESYLGHEVFPSRPVFPEPEYVTGKVDHAAALKTLKRAWETISAARTKVRAAYIRLNEADTESAQAAIASALLRGGYRIDPKLLELNEWSAAAAGSKRNAAAAAKRKAVDFLVTYETVLRKRIGAALRLITAPQIASRLKNADAVDKEARRLLEVLSRLRDGFGRFDELRAIYSTLVVATRIASEADTEIYGTIIAPRLSEALDIVREGRTALTNVEYPFDHAHGRISVAEYLLEYVPGMSDPNDAFDAVSMYLENIATLYFRLLGRLAFIASKVEQIVGLPPLQRPARKSPRRPDNEQAKSAER